MSLGLKFQESMLNQMQCQSAHRMQLQNVSSVNTFVQVARECCPFLLKRIGSCPCRTKAVTSDHVWESKAWQPNKSSSSCMNAIYWPFMPQARHNIIPISYYKPKLVTLTLIPRLHYQPVSIRISSCALTSPVSTPVCVYITTVRTGLNQRQLVRLFHSTIAGSRSMPKHVRASR